MVTVLRVKSRIGKNLCHYVAITLGYFLNLQNNNIDWNIRVLLITSKYFTIRLVVIWRAMAYVGESFDIYHRYNSLGINEIYIKNPKLRHSFGGSSLGPIL